ncbi:MAG: YkgJ family cysteine cluster protein [Proteobacteria bacterium]|nr:YkgJ family cysteine cluster protein [Pseudomonadota bacterium]
MNTENNTNRNKGIRRLEHPILPLVDMVQFLYLTGSFETIAKVLDEMNESIEIKGSVYENPRQLLAPYMEMMQDFEVVKGPRKLPYTFPFIVNEKQEPQAKLKSLELWIKQRVLAKELEEINSILCEPCGCVLCCTGPDSGFDETAGYKKRMQQEFFEIPLLNEEIDLFELQRVDNDESRNLTAQSDTALDIDGAPFYKHDMALYHWQNGWSLILPRGSVCPQLATETKRCRVYAKRPAVCRRPQIFPYIVEELAEKAKRSDGKMIQVYMAREKILAVWDCPYVRQYYDEIVAYAERSRVEPVFRKSKK